MNKINFNFEEHKEKLEVVHCRTEEEAIQWCQFMHDNGLKWCNGAGYLKYNNWGVYKEDICYNFNGGGYGNTDYYIKERYVIIEFSSLLVDPDLVKKELDGIYFRIERNGKYDNICFSDLTEEEKYQVMKDKDEAWLKKMCVILSDILYQKGCVK